MRGFMSNRRRIRSQARDRAPRSRALPGTRYGEPVRRTDAGLTVVLVAVDAACGEWCAAAHAEELALVRWRTAVGEERPLAAAAFVAALEREERAALEYRVAWEAWCATVQ
jgi:hypothetical protein